MFISSLVPQLFDASTGMYMEYISIIAEQQKQFVHHIIQFSNLLFVLLTVEVTIGKAKSENLHLTSSLWEILFQWVITRPEVSEGDTQERQ